MAHSLSAKKRIRQNENRRSLNRWRKRQVRTSVREFLDAVHEGDADKAQELYRKATKALDKIASSGTIHKNAAARSKSRLAKRLNAMTSTSAS